MEKLISLPCFPYDPLGVLRGKMQNKSPHEAPRQVSLSFSFPQVLSVTGWWECSSSGRSMAGIPWS